MRCKCGGKMIKEKRKLKLKKGKVMIPIETDVWVCRECGREQASLGLAFYNDVIEVKEEKDGKVK